MSLFQSILTAIVVNTLGVTGFVFGVAEKAEKCARTNQTNAEQINGSRLQLPRPVITESWQSDECMCELTVSIENKWNGSSASIPVKLMIHNRSSKVIYLLRNRLGEAMSGHLKTQAGR
jgi:hypothetical protein